MLVSRMWARRSVNSVAATLLALAIILPPASAEGAAAAPYRMCLPFVSVGGLKSESPNPNPLHHGVATYYVEANGQGACNFGPSPEDLMVAAISSAEYNNAAFCGAYVRVNGPKGSVTVRLVDECPPCEVGHLDLSPQAFGRIAELAQGQVPITWQVVSPPTSGPIAYRFKVGSSQWWTAVQVRNHRNPIARFEYRASGSDAWTIVGRSHDNFFTASSGMGPGPYDFRVTDIYGHVLIDHNIPLMPNRIVTGSGQFPAP